ncbi:hypothetical protein AOCH_006775 [Aspergillus ochraceoroseus]|uniref:Transcription factor Iwr1 domain-containing protein n=1 Tax=Aspergillus ochraceoroseus TaxID=138278 RepID=A0A0F8WRT7_9EURO|nr:hypothetical protein AOCH_006775 [Aspergillus ochraceoroseus]
MALPPEQINIKRRREEEPVDTLFIQSELHQTKRRFTDFVFQRVTISASQARRSGLPSPSDLTASQRTVRSPRSVSSIHLPKTTNKENGGVPLVRATSPGAEIRDERRIAAARKEAEERLKKALYSSPTPSKSDSEKGTAAPESGEAPGAGVLVSSTSSGQESPPALSSAGLAPSIRRFQISRSSTPGSPLRSTGGGVQKRRGDGAIAVLVEKLRREPHSRQASYVADAVVGRADDAALAVSQELTPARPRKRPVVNQAEKKWREERQGAISAAKEHITQVLEKEAQAHQRNWEEESERLARELEQIALELDGEMEGLPTDTKLHSPTATRAVIPKPPLKYQPRTPNKPRAVTLPAADIKQGDAMKPATTEQDGSDSDEEYVYDTYIRRPLSDEGLLTDPLVDLELGQEAWLRRHGIDATRQDIGVIVITPEDEIYWADFVEEDDEDRWDSEDGDSNAENNPANDYPDEDLSWDDEEDDPAAIYRKYRHGRSDDEEFDGDDSTSEGAGAGGFGNRLGGRLQVESDEESW